MSLSIKIKTLSLSLSLSLSPPLSGKNKMSKVKEDSTHSKLLQNILFEDLIYECKYNWQ